MTTQWAEGHAADIIRSAPAISNPVSPSPLASSPLAAWSGAGTDRRKFRCGIESEYLRAPIRALRMGQQPGMQSL